MPDANAHPKKRFFIDMFTRDISLEECILDLLDNSIDGVIRSRGISPADISQSIFSTTRAPRRRRLPTIELTYSQKEITVKDTCGGIDYDYAMEEAFNFGHSPESTSGHLGVYGIGLKRALFKMGNYFSIRSQTTENGFTCELDVRKWVKDDSSLDDWKVPLERISGTSSAQAGTEITVTRLHDEVKMRLQDGLLETALGREISVTYAFLLEKYVRVLVNGEVIRPYDIPLAVARAGKVQYEELSPAKGVKARLYASIAATDDRGRWPVDRAGWYVACNGRIVLDADQSALSGWGVPPMQKFHPKFRQFIGLAFFESDDAHKLPWTTTKRGLNKESAVYLRVRNKMASISEPVLSYLSDLYGATRSDEEPVDKEIGTLIKRVSVGSVTSRRRTDFTPPKRKKSTKTSVQYDVEKEELEKVKKHLRRRLSAGAVGRHTFDYFLEQEGIS